MEFHHTEKNWIVICNNWRRFLGWTELCVKHEFLAQSPSPNIGCMPSPVVGGPLCPVLWMLRGFVLADCCAILESISRTNVLCRTVVFVDLSLAVTSCGVDFLKSFEKQLQFSNLVFVHFVSGSCFVVESSSFHILSETELIVNFGFMW